jgi:hypothetical protein
MGQWMNGTCDISGTQASYDSPASQRFFNFSQEVGTWDCLLAFFGVTGFFAFADLVAIVVSFLGLIQVLFDCRIAQSGQHEKGKRY